MSISASNYLENIDLLRPQQLPFVNRSSKSTVFVKQPLSTVFQEKIPMERVVPGRAVTYTDLTHKMATQRLIRVDVKPTPSDIEINARIKELIRIKDEESALSLITASTARQLNVKGDDGSTLLHAACSKGLKQIVRKLVTIEGVKCNTRNKEKMSPLDMAIVNDEEDIALWLIANSTPLELNSPGKKGCTALHLACNTGLQKVVEKLLSIKSVKRDSRNDANMTPLEIAMMNGDEDLALLFIAKSTPRELKSHAKKGVTVLRLACEKGLLRVIKKLLCIIDITHDSKNDSDSKESPFDIILAYAPHDSAPLIELLRGVPKDQISSQQMKIIQGLLSQIVKVSSRDAEWFFQTFPEVAAQIDMWEESELQKAINSMTTDEAANNLVVLLKQSKKPLFQNIEKRFQQILEASKNQKFETTPVKTGEMLKLACFIEIEVHPFRNITSSQVFKMKRTGLTRTLQFDAATGELFIIANKKVSQLVGEGSFKKVLSSVGLALGDYQRTFSSVRVFTKVTTTSKQGFIYTMGQKTLEKAREDALKEAAIAKQFSGMPGFMKLHSFSDYTFTIKGIQKPRVSLMYEAADGSLNTLYKSPQPLSFSEQLKLAQGFIYGLEALHKEGYMHGDVKPANLLVIREDLTTKKARGAVTDFGFTRKETAGQPPVAEAPKRKKNGHYGTPFYEAPELVSNFSGDHFKVDVFALGLSLYEARYGRDLVRAIKKRDVEADVTRLLLTNSRSKEEEYNFLIYRLLRKDPAQRLSLAEAKAAIDALVSK